jgi:hypothetical protein
MRSTNIARLKNLSLEKFQKDFLTKRLPVIMADSYSCPAISLWNKEYFKKLYPDKLVTLQVLFNEVSKVSEDASTITLPLPEALDLIYNNTNLAQKYYLMQQSMQQNFPELLNDIELPKYADKHNQHKINLWLGEAGLNTRPHYDTPDNFLAQIMGRKLVRLFSPDMSDKMYPHSIEDKFFADDTAVYISRIRDTELINYDEFPKLKHVTCFEGILHPGDLLFIPSGWWHEVKSLDKSISVNFWWKIKLENFSAQFRNLIASFFYWYKNDFNTTINEHFDCSSFKNDIEIAKFFVERNQKCIAAFFLLNYCNKVLNDKHLGDNLKTDTTNTIQSWCKYLEIAKKESDDLINHHKLLDIINTLFKFKNMYFDSYRAK